METVNSQQAQRVWQRVHTPPAQTDDTARLIAGEWETAAACTLLARRTGGKFGPQLRQLARRSRSRWACLQGIALLHTGRRPPHSHPDTPGQSAAQVLGPCCRDALERAALYEQSAALPAPLAAHLAQEQTRDAKLLLELLGNWEL